MADVEVKKKRKLSDVFKRKNKKDKAELEGEVGDVRKIGKETVNDSEEKNVENADVQGSHEDKRKKFGQRSSRFLSSFKMKSKKQLSQPVGDKSETQNPQVVDEEDFAMDEDKADQLDKDEEKEVEKEEEKEEECFEEKDNKESTEKDNNEEFTPEVQNVQLESESPEVVIQSDSEESTVQTMAINVNDNNQQLQNDVLMKDESQNTEEGSLIRALLRQGVPSQANLPHECLECTSGSSKHGQDEEKCDSNEVGRISISMLIANFLDILIPGSMSNITEIPTNLTKTEVVYSLVLQTADQTYSSLVTLINAVLTRAGEIPKQALANFLIYLIKKYPQCFKIKKVKCKAVLPDDQVPVVIVK